MGGAVRPPSALRSFGSASNGRSTQIIGLSDWIPTTNGRSSPYQADGICGSCHADPRSPPTTMTELLPLRRRSGSISANSSKRGSRCDADKRTTHQRTESCYSRNHTRCSVHLCTLRRRKSTIVSIARNRRLQLRDNADGVLGLLGWSVIPGSAASSIQINRGSTGNPSINLGQLGSGFTFSDSFPLYLEDYLGYAAMIRSSCSATGRNSGEYRPTGTALRRCRRGYRLGHHVLNPMTG
jgi:hypothetical protein